MKGDFERYVADIEIPDGMVSVDCEVRAGAGAETEILFMLNRSTCAATADSREENFRARLESRGEVSLRTRSPDAGEFITGTLAAAYGPRADVTLAKTETD